MILFFDAIPWLLFSCMFAAVGVVIAAYALTQKRSWNSWKFVILPGVLIVSFLLGSWIFLNPGYRLQMALIAPSIQQALDTQCTSTHPIAIDGEFYNSSGYQWHARDSSALCYLSGDNWDCNC